MQQDKFSNPYLVGIGLGLVLLASFLIVGQGLGASGAAHRLGVTAVNWIAPKHVDHNPYIASMKANGASPMDNWYVFEILGALVGGAFSALLAGRFRPGVVRGPRIGTRGRLAFALTGGILMGIAARMARGCTSGQALSGGALLSVGSWVFMLSIFIGGYAMAYFIRRQWI